MLNLRQTLMQAKTAFEKAKIDFALIGGFALGAHGIHRATKDIDFLVDGTKKELIKEVLTKSGFNLDFESKEVMQFSGPGFIDVLLANRPLSIEMLKSAETFSSLNVPVVSPEGIIGLKIQAYVNDNQRKLLDLADIQALLKLPNIDFKKVKLYADLFGVWKEIESLTK